MAFFLGEMAYDLDPRNPEDESGGLNGRPTSAIAART